MGDVLKAIEDERNREQAAMAQQVYTPESAEAMLRQNAEAQAALNSGFNSDMDWLEPDEVIDDRDPSFTIVRHQGQVQKPPNYHPTIARYINEYDQAIEPLGSLNDWSADLSDALREIQREAHLGNKRGILQHLMRARAVCDCFLEESEQVIQNCKKLP